MRRRAFHIALALIALGALAVPAETFAKNSKRPVITRVKPMRLRVGAKVEVRGRNFSAKRTRNTVVFRGPDQHTAFAKPRRASRRRLVVIVPRGTARALGSRSTARFKLRVIVRRKFSTWTRKRLSPVIVSSTVAGEETGGGGGGGGGGGLPPSTCLAGDDDGDLLPGTLEQQLGTDPCLRDTDGDGVEDGYEYQSAKDLNNDEQQLANTSLPYPGKRPYPNALDPSDAGTDFDRDSLSLREEQRAWNYTTDHGSARTLTPLTYSDGEQYSVYSKSGDSRDPALAAVGYAKQADFLNWASAHGYRTVHLSDGPPWYSAITGSNYGLLDMNRNGSEAAGIPAGYIYPEQTYYDTRADGYLSDDERDEDADGLTNFDETHGRMRPGYWEACYSQEHPHPVSYAGTDFLDADSDGDSVRDGADDQDHDDVPNVMELSRNAASGLWDGQAFCKPLDGLPSPPATNHPAAYGRVNPFNPCLPATWSRTCDAHPPLEEAGAPFDNSLNWAALN